MVSNLANITQQVRGRDGTRGVNLKSGSSLGARPGHSWMWIPDQVWVPWQLWDHT